MMKRTIFILIIITQISVFPQVTEDSSSWRTIDNIVGQAVKIKNQNDLKACAKILLIKEKISITTLGFYNCQDLDSIIDDILLIKNASSDNLKITEEYISSEIEIYSASFNIGKYIVKRYFAAERQQLNDFEAYFENVIVLKRNNVLNFFNNYKLISKPKDLELFAPLLNKIIINGNEVEKPYLMDIIFLTDSTITDFEYLYEDSTENLRDAHLQSYKSIISNPTYEIDKSDFLYEQYYILKFMVPERKEIHRLQYIFRDDNLTIKDDLMYKLRL